MCSYAMFHPLAFLVKLNIEMTMANLIEKTAIEKCRNNDCSNLVTFASQRSDMCVGPVVSKTPSSTSDLWLRRICRSKSVVKRGLNDDGTARMKRSSVDGDVEIQLPAAPHLVDHRFDPLERDGWSMGRRSDKGTFGDDVEAMSIVDSLTKREGKRAEGLAAEEILPTRSLPVMRKD
jgi:hypothetical protein